MIRLAVIFLLCGACAASAQLPIVGVGGGQGGFGGGAGTSCPAGKLDLSLGGANAGCNIPAFIMRVFPW